MAPFPAAPTRPLLPPLRGAHWRGAKRDLRQKLGNQPLKVVDAVFALRVEAPAIVGAGPEPALDMLAERDVFLLDLVGEGDRLLHRLPAWPGAGLGEEPLEDGQRLVDAEREDQVRAH